MNKGSFATVLNAVASLLGHEGKPEVVNEQPRERSHGPFKYVYFVDDSCVDVAIVPLSLLSTIVEGNMSTAPQRIYATFTSFDLPMGSSPDEDATIARLEARLEAHTFGRFWDAHMRAKAGEKSVDHLPEVGEYGAGVAINFTGRYTSEQAIIPLSVLESLMSVGMMSPRTAAGRWSDVFDVLISDSEASYEQLATKANDMRDYARFCLLFTNWKTKREMPAAKEVSCEKEKKRKVEQTPDLYSNKAAE